MTNMISQLLRRVKFYNGILFLGSGPGQVERVKDHSKVVTNERQSVSSRWKLVVYFFSLFWLKRLKNANCFQKFVGHEPEKFSKRKERRRLRWWSNNWRQKHVFMLFALPKGPRAMNKAFAWHTGSQGLNPDTTKVLPGTPAMCTLSLSQCLSSHANG